MKTIIKTTEQLAQNIYNIAKSFAEVNDEECQSKETILKSLIFYEWYCKKNNIDHFYCRISTTDGFIMMNDNDIYDNGLICKVFVYDKEIRVIYMIK